MRKQLVTRPLNAINIPSLMLPRRFYILSPLKSKFPFLLPNPWIIYKTYVGLNVGFKTKWILNSLFIYSFKGNKWVEMPFYCVFLKTIPNHTHLFKTGRNSWWSWTLRPSNWVYPLTRIWVFKLMINYLNLHFAVNLKCICLFIHLSICMEFLIRTLQYLAFS